MTSNSHHGHEARPFADASADTRPQCDSERFPTRLIPIVVPLLAVLLASVVYFLMAEIL